MKFAVFAVVVLALAAGAQSSVIPWLSVEGPGSIAIQASSPNGPHAAVAVHTIPHIIGAPGVVALAPVAGQASYVAKTLGVVHVAPLPGHTQSATALNLQPAPGTA